MKKLLSLFLLFIFVFIGSVKSDKYHREECGYASKIKQENIVVFETVKEAEEQNYIPCKICIKSNAGLN